MDNNYLQQLIDEANARGGGLILSSEDIPRAVVLSIEKYNNLMQANQELAINSQLVSKPVSQPEKVLVTGGAGYIGGHLVRELVKAGYEVLVLDNLSSGKVENIDPKALFIQGDLGDEDLLSGLFSTHRIAGVFHMAASLEVEESVREPVKYFRNNVENTFKLLSAMAKSGVKKIVFSSTAAVYGETQNSPVSEASPLKPNNPYGYSKLMAERSLKYFAEFCGFRVVTFRYFNACGFDSISGITPTHGTHLLYNVLSVARGDRPYLQVFGHDYDTFDGTCIRDYVHVLDIVLPHILAFEKMDDTPGFEIFNIGTGRGQSVLEMVNAASAVLNRIIPMEIAMRRTGDAPVTVADNSRLIKVLGYRPSHSTLEEMIVSSWEVMGKKVKV